MNTSRPPTTLERRQQILELLDEHGRLSLVDLAGRFGISEMTVRRDLDALERDSAVTRVRGGVIAVASRSSEPPYALRIARNGPAKQRIALAAAALIRDGETIALDAGSTVLALADALADRRNLTVVTPNLRAAWVLADNPDLRVIVTGGLVRPGERALNGVFSERAFEDLLCDTFFMGVGGVDPEAGFTEYTLDGTRTKQAALRSARRRVVVADGSKLGKIAFVRVTPIDGADTLITDAEADPAVVTRLRETGLEVICA
ncbi:MAG: DeoR/GlpR transcriptional regulator [Thermomicrobiales bacterium]|nr:DeoR/GlpR transcriptional regulator [Thermomicrobiales bacterium]